VVSQQPTRPTQRRQRLTGNQLLALGGAGSVVLILLAIASLKLGKKPPPPLPSEPPPSAQAEARNFRYSAAYYRTVLEEDSRRYKVPRLTADMLAAPFVYAAELTEPRRLDGKHASIDTPHLRISSHVAKEWASTASGQRFRTEHLVVSITNNSDWPVAYLVETSVNHPEACRSQGAIAHNAVALAAGETIERSECLWHPDGVLTVHRVEVMEVPALSYYYLSRLNPVQLLLDERTAAGHTPPAGTKECAFVPWRDIKASAAEANTGWADVMDFYARHNCDEYSYPRGYRRWTAPGKLPAGAPQQGPSSERVDQPTARK
jgi:hypothetical protein